MRYADDIRVFVRSERAAVRVLDGVTDFVEGRLALTVNRDKSAITTASSAGLLGFAFYFLAGGKVGVRVHAKARKRVKERIRQLTRRRWSISMPERVERLNRFIAGWMAYFGIAETRSVFDELDEWLRRRLRQIRWKEWKRFAARRRNLIALGIRPDQAREWAASSKGYWRVAGSPILKPRTAQRLLARPRPAGLQPPLAQTPVAHDEPPDADPHVRWCERGRVKPAPYSILATNR